VGGRATAQAEQARLRRLTEHQGAEIVRLTQRAESEAQERARMTRKVAKLRKAHRSRGHECASKAEMASAENEALARQLEDRQRGGAG